MASNRQLLIDVGPGMSMMLGLPRISSWHTVDRPKSPKRGTLGYNTETSSIEYYDGSHWVGASLG